MKKQKIVSYASFWGAEIIAVLYDNLLFILRDAGGNETAWVMYELAPLFIIGVLIVVGLRLGRNLNLQGLFIGLAVVNLVIFAINRLPLYCNPIILFNYQGMAIMLGVSVGGIVSGLINKCKIV